MKQNKALGKLEFNRVRDSKAVSNLQFNKITFSQKNATLGFNCKDCMRNQPSFDKPFRLDDGTLVRFITLPDETKRLVRVQ